MSQDQPTTNNPLNITGVTGSSSKIVQLALRYYTEGWVLRIKRIKGRYYLYARKYDRTRKDKIERYLGPVSEDELMQIKASGILLLSGESLVDKCKLLIADGWTLHVKRRKSTIYISARKMINGRHREIYVSKVTLKDLEELEQLGLLTTNSYETQVPITVSVPQSQSGEQLIGEQLVGNNWLGNNEWGTAIGEQLSTTIYSAQKTLVIPERVLKGAIALLLKLKGYLVIEEKSFSLQRIDIYAEKGNEKLVIEIESVEENYREGLRQLSHVYAELGNSARYILVLPTASEYVREVTNSLGFELWTVNEIVKEFCKVGDN